jgi:hypothetical protein
VKELDAAGQADAEGLPTLGRWLGRRQAFGMIANRCTAADADYLKQMRDSGKYKELGTTWAKFCQERAGISRVSTDRLINHLEEFGANYFRLSELMQISGETYRLIAGAVSEDSIFAREPEAGDGGGGVATREGAGEVERGYYSAKG